MLFLTHWELDEGMSSDERLQIAQKLTASGLFPPEGVNLLRWDATPDGWGIILFEANTEADVMKVLASWRSAGAGFFKSTKTAPAGPIGELMPVFNEMLAKVKAV